MAKNALCHETIAPDATTDDIIVQSLPADDIFTVVVPASKIYSNAFDSSIVPRDLVEYMKTKSAGNITGYLHGMCAVSGVGRVTAEVAEIENMKRSIEEFMSKWAKKIAEIDDRFKGTLLHSGSVYEGTKVGDPDEFDYMLCLDGLAQICSIIFDEDTKYDEVVVHKSVDESRRYEELFDGEQLESGKVMSVFVEVAKRALTVLDLTSVAREMYVEGLTEHTLVEDTWTLAGTVTCNLKFKWTGLYYKQLVITVDLVPAIPLHHWPQIAREASSLLTEDIKSRGCHLVPKSGYWRLSFSLAEKLIMGSLSKEQKLAFVGAKVSLHPAVSCKIVVYDDENVEKVESPGSGLEDDGHTIGACYGEDDIDQNVCAAHCAPVKAGVSGEETMKKMQDTEDTSSLTKEVDDAANSSESRSVSEAQKPSSSSLLATMAGRVVLPQSGDAATVLKLYDSQDSETLQQWLQNNADRVTIVSSREHAQKRPRIEEAADSSEDGSDVPVKILLPFNVLSTYLLKNLFFNCIEESAQDASGSTVTTGQIFSKLFESLTERRPVPYYFIPKQNFVGLDTLSFDDDRSDLLLVTMVINSLLNDALSDDSETG